jgi:hypothetical protein
MVPQNVAEIIRDHVVLEVEGIDRMYLNAYRPSWGCQVNCVTDFLS